MKETSLKPVIEKLENLFSKFNEKFYNNELQTPIITVSPDTTKGAYGWCTAWKAWTIGEQKKVADLSTLTKEDLEAMKKDDGFYEINICAEHLARPFEQVAETLLHEMVHLYNLQIGVQDTSRKYVCPVCGCIIRATKEVHVICGDCSVEFEEEA